jgi:glycosyltransferase involved in cell wall biosynthesis
MHAAIKKGSPPPLFFDLKGAFYAGTLLNIKYHLHLTDPPSLLPTEISKFAYSLRNAYPSARKDLVKNPYLMVRGEGVHQLNKRGASNALSLIVMSNLIADELKKIYGIKAKIVRPGVDKLPNSQNLAFPLKDKLQIISVCRLEANKRLDWILKALANLESSIEPLSKKIDWSLDIVGDGSIRESLKHLAIQLGISKRVVFHGKITDLMGNKLFENANLFLMPAAQGYGLPALESLARGVPVILHQDSGVSEVLKGSPWAEIFEGDANSLAQAIIMMIDRLRDNKSIKNTAANFPSERNWAHEVCTLCRWL